MKETTLSKQIIDVVFEDGEKQEYTREEAIAKVTHILTLMTKNQRKEMVKKVRRCEYYIAAIDRGLDRTLVRSLLMRKEGLSRQNLNDVCKPCEEILHKNNI